MAMSEASNASNTITSGRSRRCRRNSASWSIHYQDRRAFPRQLSLALGKEAVHRRLHCHRPCKYQSSPNLINSTRSLHSPNKSAYTPHPRPPGQTSYSFQWSIPNMIPLPPSEILKIWRAIEPYEFDTTYGAFVGMDVRDGDLKGRMLESMKIQTRGEGWEMHEMLDQTV